MVLPFVNMTIKGATWFQGENNCFECDAAILDTPRVPLLGEWRGAPVDDAACYRRQCPDSHSYFPHSSYRTPRPPSTSK